MKKQIVLVAGKDPIVELGGGHSSYVRAHARAVLRMGFEPHLFCVSSSAGIVETDYGIVHRLRSPYRHFLKDAPGTTFKVSTAPLHEGQLAKAIQGFLSGRRGPQLIHGFGVWSSAAALARGSKSDASDWAMLASVYHLLDHEQMGKVHGLGPDHRLRHHVIGRAEQLWVSHTIGRLEALGYCGADQVLVNYESMRLLLEARFGPTLRIRKAPYTSEWTFLPPSADSKREAPRLLANLEPQDAPLIVSVSRHDPRKGVNILLHALGRLRAANIPFRACLVGRGQLIEEHRRLATRLGLDRSTAITGLVDDPRDYLRLAGIFVLPSLEESSGSISLIEALEQGVPVVASSVDGIPEDIRHEESGLLVEPGSVDALTEALSRLLGNAELRHQFAKASRSVFAEQFSSSRFVTALSEIYAESGVEP